jgi:hypothetical protein
MLVNPLVVNELRALFRAGATPSAIIRRVAERHPFDPNLDGLVRAYFREAFHVPMIRVGPEQVQHVAQGGQLAGLNAAVVPQMLQARSRWDQSGGSRGPGQDCWMDAVAPSDEAARSVASHPERIPELAGSWDRMDETARQFVTRLIGNAHALNETVHALAALAEQIQHRAAQPAPREARGA